MVVGSPPKSGGLRLLGALTVVPTFIVALVGVFAAGFGLVEAISDLFGSTPSTATVQLRDSTLQLVGARGEEVSFKLVGNSAQGLWAAPRGLRLELGNDEAGSSAAASAIAPKKKDWTDPVFYSYQPGLRNKTDFEITGSFTVPDLGGPRTQTLGGSLRGEFLYPGETTDDMHFTTAHLELDIPATLKVVTAKESERLHTRIRWERWRTVGLGVLYSVIGLGYPISYGTWKDGEQTRRFEPYVTLLAGIAMWACIAALWLRPFGA